MNWRWVALLLLLNISCTKKDVLFHEHLVLADFGDATVSGEDEHGLTLDKGGERLKLRAIKLENLAAARSLFSVRLGELFNPPPAPYPGYISNRISCDDSSKPVKFEQSSATFKFDGVRFFANGRFMPGECLPAQMKYRYYRGFLLCKDQKNIFEIEFFSPTSAGPLTDASFIDKLQHISCK